MEEVASLRENRGVTVKYLQRCRRNTSEMTSQETYQTFTRHRFCATGGKTPLCSSTASGQLLGKLKRARRSDDVPPVRDLQCFSNCSLNGLYQSRLIRLRLTRPSCGEIITRPRFASVLVLTLLYALLHSTSATSSEKFPLVRAKVSSQRVFRGVESVTSSLPSKSLLRSAFAGRGSSIEPLDFQTLKVVKKWGDEFSDVLLVGGRNYVYMFNATQSRGSGKMTYIRKVRWVSSETIKYRCRAMRNEEVQCNNYIRIVEILSDGRLYLCGTDAFSPKCRFYQRSHLLPGNNDLDTPFDGEKSCQDTCGCPRMPETSSTHLYTNTSQGSRLFSGVIPDYRGKTSFLMRSDVPFVQTMDGLLNNPTFLKLIEYEDKVYMFFREVASPVETGMDGHRFYARVAQVCKDDVGGTTILTSQWTTFLKARLECSIPGSTFTEGFLFNNLTSVSDVITVKTENGTDDVIFATFTTPWNLESVSMSAVCVFSMRKNIQALFNHGSFMGEIEFLAKPKHSTDNQQYSETVETKKAVKILDSYVPTPRPGSCQSSAAGREVLFFIKKHPLMYDSVKPLYNSPIFTTESNVRLTQITVDANAGYQKKLVLYLGTEHGSVLKVRPRFHSNGPKSVALMQMQIIEEDRCKDGSMDCTTRAMHVNRPELGIRRKRKFHPNLFVAYSNQLTTVQLSQCSLYANPECCNADPECGWISSCIKRTQRNNNSLPRTSDLNSIPTKCEKLLAPTTECNDRDNARNDVTQTTTPKMGCNINPGNPQKEVIGVRSVVGSRKLETPHKDDPSVHRCNDAGNEQEKIAIMRSDDVILDLFRERVLPLVSSTFHETYHSLPNRNLKDSLFAQLQDALAMTTNMVLRNHKQENYLGTCTVNSLTHAYPLLMREIESWHHKALEMMTSEDLMNDCWSRPATSTSPCIRDVAISIPLAPTLWDPLKNLMTEFGAKCDVIAGANSKVSNCSHVSSIESCKDERLSNTPHCQPKQCQFVGYAMDVAAFFRHVNDCQKFLPSGMQPLWKNVNVSLSSVNAIRGHLELFLNRNYSFIVRYSPVPEKVKISFFYKGVKDCNLNDANCNGRRKGCSPELERTVGSWFKKLISSLRPKKRKCTDQHEKFMNHQRSDPQTDSQLLRSKRSGDNRVRPEMHKYCRYVKKTVSRLRARYWDDLIDRASERGGVYNDDTHTITFHSLDHLRDFFDNKCSIQPPPPEVATFGKIVKKKKSKNDVRVLVSSHYPFVIERDVIRNRTNFKYFTYVVKRR